MRYISVLFVAIMLVLGHHEGRAAEETRFDTISYVGQLGDSVQGVRIQSDGTLVMAANVVGGPFNEAVKGAPGEGKGLVVRLSSDGNKILSAIRVGRMVRDLAIDARDNIYVAADCAIKLDPAASKIVWKKDVGGACDRIDAGADGYCAALRYSEEGDTKTGTGTIFVFDPDGKAVADFRGHNNTLDLCVDAASKTLVHIGWRQANAFDGKKKYPVQIAYLQGRSYRGDVKYTLYDWSTDATSPSFINKPTNNMADTRGYRCAIGGDGRLCCVFECAGGNHIFRYEPQLVDGQWADAADRRPKGDKYQEFFSSRSEHKTFIGRYDPTSGKYLAGQQFCGRLANNRANTVRVKNGAVAGGESGMVIVGGVSASGLPISFFPPNSGDYAGGSYLLALQANFKDRLFCTRFQGGGCTHAVDTRKVRGRWIFAAGGTTSDKREEALTPLAAIQPKGEAGSGFLAVLSRPADE